MNFNNYKSKSNLKNKTATIDLVNVVYDEEFVSLINSLSKTIKNYYTLTLNIIRDLYNNSLVIDNNSIYSKCLINEINYNTKEKLKQLEEKIETISNTKKIFEKNILLVHSNLNKFFNDSKQIFQNLKNIRNSKINFAIETNKRYERHGNNNSMINFKTSFEKNDLLIDQNDNERYYKRFNNSLSNEKPLSSISYKRNRLFQLKGNSTEINKRHKMKTIYFNNNSTNNGPIISNNNSFRIKNKLFDKIPNKKQNYENNLSYKQKNKKIKIGNLNNILEFTPEISKSKSSYNNFYINQNSNINLNSNDINNVNNNNLELSYKVIEFLSLLSNISKNNAKNNPNIHKMIQNFEKTKKNLFELSKKFIEQNNDNESKIYSRKTSTHSSNDKGNNNISKKDMQLILMNNNIENIKKGIEYKELIDKINYLSNNINKLEKQNEQLSIINSNIKKELINNNLVLSKKDNQLNLINKEKTQYISQINVLQKDNEALMELIQEKNNKDINKKEKSNINEINIIKQKEKIINDLNKKINEFEKKILDKNNEANIMNNKITQLNDSLNILKSKIQEKDKIIQQIESENKNKIIMSQQNIKNSFNNSELIFEQLEELAFVPENTTHIKTLNIEQIESFNLLNNDSKKDIISLKLNNEDISKLENKIEELNSIIDSKENEIKKYKNENSILKSFTKIKKNNKEDDDDEDNDTHKLEEEIKKLKLENQSLIEEKNNLEINFKKLLSDNKNVELKLDSKNKEVENLENNVKELEDQIKEIQMKNIQKIYNEQNSLNDKIEEEKESRNNKIQKILEADTDKNNEIIAQLKEELKEKENEIEYLKIELQELKSKVEENEDNYFDSSLKNSDINDKYNDKYNSALEEKIKFLTERNEYYQKLYNDDKIKLQNLENINNNLKNEIEELRKNKAEQKNEENFSKKEDKANDEDDKEEKKEYSLKNYNIICDKIYGELKWYLLVNKSEFLDKEKEIYNYDNLFWVPKINIIDIDSYQENKNENNEIKKEDTTEKRSNKIYKNEIHINREKEISFSNISFNNNSDEANKNKQNSNNNSNSIKRGSFFSLGNVNEENNINDYNKLLEKYKSLSEKMSKAEEKYSQLQKKYSELKDKIKKMNKNNNNQKFSVSDDSNNYSNANDIGKLSIVDNNFEGEGDIIGKLNNKNEREQEYYESMFIELEATKNQLKVVKEILKEVEKKFETVKKICENLFSRITLKKKEKEEFKVLLKVMDFTDEQVALIIDKRKK